MLNLAETTLNTFFKSICYTAGSSYRPATIKTNRTSRLVAPPMFMANNHLARAINLANMNISMTFNVLANRKTHPSTTII
jgi:hypothetical protein